jgi:hypothetical protein
MEGEGHENPCAVQIDASASQPANGRMLDIMDEANGNSFRVTRRIGRAMETVHIERAFLQPRAVPVSGPLFCRGMWLRPGRGSDGGGRGGAKRGQLGTGPDFRRELRLCPGVEVGNVIKREATTDPVRGAGSPAGLRPQGRRLAWEIVGLPDIRSGFVSAQRPELVG